MAAGKTKLEWLAGGGEMTRVIAALDWSRTPLGPLETWPQSLRTTVSLCLASNFPINIIWGDQHSQIYNDGYRGVCGAVHPRAVGEDYRVTWASAWPAIGEPFERALAGETTYLENQRMFLERNGYPEETFFTFSLSPIRDESGQVVGLFHPVTETTRTMLAERRTRALRDVVERVGRATVLEDACGLLLSTLAEYAQDLPFALLYLTTDDGARARLRGACGTPEGGPFAPAEVELTEPRGADAGENENENENETTWPLARAARMGRIDAVADVEKRFGAVAAGPYPEPITTSFVLAIRVAGVEAPLGFLVVGASTRLPLDATYRAFIETLGAAASAALGNARSYEAERLRAEALSELDRAKTAFFSNVSHEFRTPLTLLLGPVEELLTGRRGSLSAEARGDLEAVHRNALRLLKLVNALLEFSRIESGRVDASFEATDLGALTRDLASAFRSAVERAGMELLVDVDALPGLVVVDREMWEKIVLNLMSNAFKFTKAGSIQVALRRVEGSAELSVTDTGVGLAASELTRVFERFHRVQGVQGRTHEGSGIGLALVHDLANLHGGSARVESVLGKGSTFFVTIPLAGPARGNVLAATLPSAPRQSDVGPAETHGARAFVEEAARWLPEPTAPSVEAELSAVECAADASDTADRRPRILLADDNADMRDYVRRLLAERFRVTVVTNGVEALEAARRSCPDLVLSDVMMPEMDGVELVKRLRADPALHTVPVILLTARAGEDATASGLELGADDYLTKPFSARELVARVESHLHMAALRRRAAEQDALVVHLAQQQSWLEAALDRLPVPTLLVDPTSGAFSFANRAANLLAGGHMPADIEGAEDSPGFRVCDAHDRPFDAAGTPGERVRRGERLHDEEAVWHSPAGRFDLAIDSDSVPAMGAQPERKVVTFRDVTRLKRVERDLTTLLDARDEFLAIVSHELRTPLTSIWMQIQLSERSMQSAPDHTLPPEKLAKTMRVLSSQIERLTVLVDDLLDVARIRTGRLSLAFESVDLVALVRDTVERLSTQLAQAGCPASVHAPATGVVGTWDARRLEQVLTNLLVNVTKYAPHSPVEVRVSPAEGGARLEVRDFGAGVPEALRDSIFDRFERGIASRSAGGLGLGLFISQQVVRAHGGTMTVETPEGGGASFVVRLPLDGATARGAAPNAPGEEAARAGAP